MSQYRKPTQRNLHGWVLLDKPVGPSSNQALQTVKRLMQAKKAGHTGSLDPLASGLLPICLGEATKYSGQLLNANKTYEVTAQWGSQTNTADAEGEVMAVSDATLDLARLPKVLDAMMGEQTQIPPMYSALKQNGHRLYDLARKNQVVERKPRKITLFELSLLEASETEFTLRVECSKGTYIRTLVEDIAKALGGLAFVKTLRRTHVGRLSLEQSVDLPQLEATFNTNSNSTEFIQPIDLMIEDVGRQELSVDQAFYLQRGQAVQINEVACDQLVRLYAKQVGESAPSFIGLGVGLGGGQLAPKRLLSTAAVTQPHKVAANLTVNPKRGLKASAS